MNDQDREFLLKSLKSRLQNPIAGSEGMICKSLKYKIEKLENPISENVYSSTSVITQSTLNNELKKEMEILEGYKKLTLDDSVINAAIKPIIAFQKNKIFLLKKQLKDEFSCYKTEIDFTTGVLNLKINKYEFDPCQEIKSIAFYIDRKCQKTIEVSEVDQEITLTFNNNILTEFYLIGQNDQTLLGMCIFPCDFFIDANRKPIIVDFGDFNYAYFNVTFENAIQLKRNEAEIKCISKQGHFFEKIYCSTPVYCNVCTKMCPIFGHAFKCSECGVRAHGNCSNYILFKCNKLENISFYEEKVKKRYNIEHSLKEGTSGGIRYCEHCGERISLGSNMFSCLVCSNNYHSHCKEFIFNSCQLTYDLRKKIAEFIPADPLQIKTTKTIKIEDFKLIAVLGKGTFGKVILAENIKDNLIVAMKVLKKDKMINSYDMSFLEAERRILQKVTQINSKQLTKMHYCFQDPYNVYFGLEYCNGGDLLSYVKKNKLSEEQIKNYSSELIMAISVLHKSNIAFRDLKLDNILIGPDGHLKLCDYGLSKDEMGPCSKTYTYCGTPDTIAPEVFTLKGYTKNVDFWSLGVVIYEMFHRYPPFVGATTKELAKNISKKELNIRAEMSDEAADFIKMLLMKSPEKRLGSGENAVSNIKAHPWLSDVQWDDVLYGKNPVFHIPDGSVVTEDPNSDDGLVTLSETLSVRGFNTFFRNFN